MIVLCLTVGLVGLKFASARLATVDSDYEPAWSPDGTRIAFFSQRDGSGDIYSMQSDGTDVVRLTNSFYSLTFSGRSGSPAWSPDGGQLAFVSNRKGKDDIYIMDSDGSHVVRLTDSRADDKESSAGPDWSPDGQHILFTAQVGSLPYGLPVDGSPARLPTSDIYVVNVDGSGLTRLTSMDGFIQSPRWSPDGSRIAFIFTKGQTDIYVMDADGNNFVQVTNDSANEIDLDWSPDGSRFVFTSGDIFHNNVFTMNIDGTDVKQLTDTQGIGDSSPGWSPDGSRIAFVSKHPETRLNHIFIMNEDGSNLVQLTGN